LGDFNHVASFRGFLKSTRKMNLQSISNNLHQAPRKMGLDMFGIARKKKVEHILPFKKENTKI
jgi:hypothetical protein